MFQAGGRPWGRWNPIVRDTLIRLQRHDGCARGSWDADSRWGAAGGRIYTTALAVLTPEVYYRYPSHIEASEAFRPAVTAIEGLDGGLEPGAVELHQRSPIRPELHERGSQESTTPESVE